MNRGDAALAIVMVIFGLTFIAIKVALAELGPLSIALARFMIASVILIPLAGSPRGLPPRTIGLMGLTGVAAFFALQNIGLAYTTASNASLILASIPAMTAILSWVVFSELPGRTRTFGIVLSMSGVGLIVAAGGGFSESSIGDILILLSAFTWAAYTIIGKKAAEYPTVAVTAYSILIGTFLLIPPAAWELSRHPLISISTGTVVSILFLGGVASAAAFFLYNLALRYVDASRAALYTNLSPLVTVAAGTLYLHETLLPLHIVGGLLVLIGISLDDKKEKRVARG